MISYFAAALAFWGALLGGGFYFARRHVRALEARAGNDAELLELRARVQTLEDALDATRQEVQRLGNARELTTKLSSARAEPNDPPTRTES